MQACCCSFADKLIATQESVDPYEDFKRIFGKFATAEQVTGAAPMSDDEDEEGGEDVVKVRQTVFPWVALGKNASLVHHSIKKRT